MIKKVLLSVIVLAVILTYCSVNKQHKDKFQKNPVDELVRNMNSIPEFSIILYDMDFDEAKDIYKQQYQIVKHVSQPKDTILSEITKWYPVPQEFFDEHTKDMGMEIVTKTNGKVTKETAPPGYSNYVGNPQYGHWNNSGGSSFWEFYGKYAMMSSLFHMAFMPVRYSMWNDYNSMYRGRGQTFYGGGAYGSNSRFAKFHNPMGMGNRSGFASRVQSRVSRSMNNPFKSTGRVARSSNRVSNFSFRSRGGGFGK
jgi:hypothetical protein